MPRGYENHVSHKCMRGCMREYITRMHERVGQKDVVAPTMGVPRDAQCLEGMGMVCYVKNVHERVKSR